MNYSSIKEVREQYGISQIKLAQHCGISPAVISAWELNKSTPSESQLMFVWMGLQELVYAIENNGLNIKKKRIRQTNKSGGDLPKKISSAEEYYSLMADVAPTESEYVKTLSELYQHHTQKRSKTAPKAISLFSGCGGLDLGFSAAGFNIVGHIELDKMARTIYSANFKDSAMLGDDICEITPEDIKNWKGIYGQIDVLIGGPPCQGFSLAGKRDPNDLRNQLYQYYVKIVSEIKPKVFVMENVRLLTSMKDSKGRLFIDQIRKAFESAGYALSLNEVNAQEYGVPQSRERIIIVGVRNDEGGNDFSFPMPTHTEKDQSYQLSFNTVDIETYRTFRDATSDLRMLESGEKSNDPLHWSISHPQHVIDWLKDVPEGCSAHDNPDPNMRPTSGFNTTYKRIKWDEPCSTISTNFSMISGARNVHPTSTRSLTIREAARAQSFPDEFAFFGGWGDVRKVIGNAVPPMLAYVIAEAIKKQLF